MRRVRVRTPSGAGRPAPTYIHMTALAARHETGRRRRFERCDDESRKTQLDTLRGLIERDEYADDAEQVADAILRRLMLERDSVNEAAPRRG